MVAPGDRGRVSPHGDRRARQMDDEPKPRKRDLFDDETFLIITGRTREEFDEAKQRDEVRRRLARERGINQAVALILLGLLAVAAGLGITFGTMALATSRGGGTFVVAWGLVLAGALSVFRGLGLLFSSPPIENGR